MSHTDNTERKFDASLPDWLALKLWIESVDPQEKRCTNRQKVKRQWLREIEMARLDQNLIRYYTKVLLAQPMPWLGGQAGGSEWLAWVRFPHRARDNTLLSSVRLNGQYRKVDK